MEIIYTSSSILLLRYFLREGRKIYRVEVTVTAASAFGQNVHWDLQVKGQMSEATSEYGIKTSLVCHALL